MRALVCGAAGFVGSHLVARLLDDGWHVVGVDSFITGNLKRNLGPVLHRSGFEFREADIVRPLEVDGSLDAVCHLASPASPVDFSSLQLEILRAHSHGMWNLLELARSKGARFLYTSSSEVYGDPEVHPQHEDYAGHVSPTGARSCYDEGKRFGEALVMAFHRRHGLRTSIARLFNTYGPHMRPDDGRVIPSFVSSALRGEPARIHGDGSQTRSFCYVDDTVDGLCRLLDSDLREPVNLGNPDERTILELAEIINDVAGNEAECVFRELPHADDPKRRQPDITRARTELGWEPRVSLLDGLGRTVGWFRQVLEG